jgi:hypothetical protein
MTPADPLWLIAELLSAVARAFREKRELAARRRALLNGTRVPAGNIGDGFAPDLGPGWNARGREPAALSDPLYSRVQAALLGFAMRRTQGATTPRQTEAVVRGNGPAISWNVDGREVVVRENGTPLFRAVWSKVEGGWRLYWSRTPDRWWPYAPLTHLSFGSFERCVQEVERDPRGCFSGAFAAQLPDRLPARSMFPVRDIVPAGR